MTTVPQNVSPPSDPSPLEYSRSGGGAGVLAMISRLGPLIGLIFVIALFSSLRFHDFFNLSNFELIIRQTAVVGTAALGMTLIIIAGGIDLSVGSMVAVVTVAIALMLPHEVTTDTGETIITHGVSPWLAALGGIAVGTLCGAVNGLLITRLRLVPFIITLGMMSLLRGAAEDLAQNTMVYPSRPVMRAAPYLSKLLEPINPDRLWLLTPGAWLMLVLAILVGAMLRYTRFGRHIFAVGSNEQTARLCGVPIERTVLYIYMLGAALTAVAAVLHFSYLGMGDCTTADGMELEIIAAVVIGGASLNGGQGTVLGSLVGALIMTAVANGCTKMG